MQELVDAEAYWITVAQQSDFGGEISSLTRGKTLPKGKLLPLHPFLDEHGLLRVGGRAKHLGLPFSQCHPIILHGKHILTRLIFQTKHLRLLHAGSTLVAASLARRFHILQGCNTIRFITRNCVICQRVTGQSRPLVQDLFSIVLVWTMLVRFGSNQAVLGSLSSPKRTWFYLSLCQ